MPPSEAELLKRRLARMKQLVESLEHECSGSAEQRATFLSLKRDLEAIRRGLQVVQPVKPVKR
jgi:hypothetical protein